TPAAISSSSSLIGMYGSCQRSAGITSRYASAAAFTIVKIASWSAALQGRMVMSPGGVERLGPAFQVLDPHHYAVAKGHDLVVQLVLELEPAALAPGEMAQPGRHAVSGVDVLLRAQLKHVERLVKTFPEPNDALDPDCGVGALMLREDPLDVGIEPPGRGVEVAPVVGVDEVAGLVDVLLGHAQGVSRDSPDASRA